MAIFLPLARDFFVTEVVYLRLTLADGGLQPLFQIYHIAQRLALLDDGVVVVECEEVGHAVRVAESATLVERYCLVAFARADEDCVCLMAEVLADKIDHLAAIASMLESWADGKVF